MYIFSDNAAGADDGVFTDGDSAEDGGIGADGGTFFVWLSDTTSQSDSVLKSAGICGGTWVKVVGEHDAVADEDFVFDGDAFADEGVALDLAVFADGGVFLYFDEGADLGIVADGAAVEVDEVVELDVFAKDNVRCYLFHNFV